MKEGCGACTLSPGSDAARADADAALGRYLGPADRVSGVHGRILSRRCGWKRQLTALAAAEITRQESSGTAQYRENWRRLLRRRFNSRSYYLTDAGLTFLSHVRHRTGHGGNPRFYRPFGDLRIPPIPKKGPPQLRRSFYFLSAQSVILPGRFCHQAAERQERNQVGEHHQRIEQVGEVPHQRRLQNGAQCHAHHRDHRVDLHGLGAEEVL